MSVPDDDTAGGAVDIGVAVGVDIVHQDIVNRTICIETATSDIVCEIYIGDGKVIISTDTIDTCVAVRIGAGIISDRQVLDRYIGNAGIDGDTISGAAETGTIENGQACSCTVKCQLLGECDPFVVGSCCDRQRMTVQRLWIIYSFLDGAEYF